MFSSAQLALCQANNSRSQRELYNCFKASVMGVCRRYTGSRQEAEDVFQEAFIRVFQNIGQVRDAEHLEQWIKRITVNAAVNYYHKHKRHQHDDLNGYSHYNDDYELILSSFSSEVLVSVINNLPNGYRMVFNLHEIEGYSHAEIAKLLLITEVTSRSQLNRAKQSIKNKLKAIGILRYEKYA